MKTILCYGDSNTYGYHPITGLRYSKEERWTCLLQRMLGDGYDVISEGLNGRTTVYDREEVWKNGYPYLLPCLNSHKPINTVIFMLGTNDCNADLHLSAEQIAEGMEILINTTLMAARDFQSFEPSIILVAPAAILPDYQNSPFADQLDDESIKKSREISPLYEKIAKKYSCKFLDGSTCLEVSKIDSEHLTENGHKTLAEKLYKILKED